MPDDLTFDFGFANLDSSGSPGFIQQLDNAEFTAPDFSNNPFASVDTSGANMTQNLFPSSIMDTPQSDPLSVTGSYADNYPFVTPSNYAFGDPTLFGTGTVGNTGLESVAAAPDDGGNYADTFGTGADIPVYTDTPNVVIADSSGTPVSSSGSGTDWASTLTQLAVAAVKINSAYQAAGKPAVRVSGTTAQGTVIANTDGTLTVNGATKLPPKGVPYLTPNGSMIVNNGDGTYTHISSSGISGTNPYPQSVLNLGSLLGGANSNTLLYAGIGLVAFLILRK